MFKGHRQIVFFTLSGILNINVLAPFPIPVCGLHTLRINYGAMKTCQDELFNNVTYNIWTISLTITQHKSQHKLKSVFLTTKGRSSNPVTSKMELLWQ